MNIGLLKSIWKRKVSNTNNKGVSVLFKYQIKSFSISMKYKFNSAVFKEPHVSKKDKGGEDAFFNHDGLICVADGVGGWAEVGVDPAKYSNELCDNIKRVFFDKGHSLFHQPKKMFVEAAEKTLSQGSATCCFCVLDLEKPYLHTLNLGDSGYLILRYKSQDQGISSENEALNKIMDKQGGESKLEIVFKSDEQQHEFNFPFQVGTHGDDPNSAITNTHSIKENDIIIVGTDGLWDNLYDKHIVQIIKPFLDVVPQIQDIKLLADMIGFTAQKYSYNQQYKSPFSERSKGLYLGGKPDDITFIISQVQKI